MTSVNLPAWPEVWSVRKHMLWNNLILIVLWLVFYQLLAGLLLNSINCAALEFIKLAWTVYKQLSAVWECFCFWNHMCITCKDSIIRLAIKLQLSIRIRVLKQYEFTCRSIKTKQQTTDSQVTSIHAVQNVNSSISRWVYSDCFCSDWSVSVSHCSALSWSFDKVGTVFLSAMTWDTW